jgi:sulfopyruvate decarboxylase subunit beta
MNRVDVLDILCSLRQNAVLIISPGLANYTIAAHGDLPLTIYNMDMPYATPIALGAALGWPARRVVSVEGDGSLLAGPSVLATIARYRPHNLIVVVFDNGAYLTTGSGRAPTATAWGADIEHLGRALGLEQCCTVRELDDAREALARAFREPGPWLIVAKVDPTDRQARQSTPLPIDVFESCLRFRRTALAQRAREQNQGSGSRP